MEAKIVKSTYGKISGLEEDGMHVFKGIPFAEPPVGRLRFRAPQPPKKWKQLLKAHKMSPAAPQGMASFYGLSEFSEDCLYLNVWSPGLDDKKRPVLFWIHGGGNTGGSAAQTVYNGVPLAKRGDVVIVTINYRLGVLGFANFRDILDPKYKAEANVGLLDQVAALEWVRDNIEKFGGNPDDVTVFGESAGGFDIVCLMSMESSKGLFHKAICQSGASPARQSKEGAENSAKALLKALNISADDPKELYKVSPDKLLGALGGGMPGSGGGFGFSPTRDGKVIPEDPMKVVANGWAKNVPLLVGSNLDEAKLFTAMIPNARSMTRDDLIQRTGAMVPGTGEKAVKVYEDAMKDRGLDNNPFEVMNVMQTDAMFRIPSIRLAEVRSATQAKTYMYLFDYAATEGPGARMGAFHALELSFVFGTLGGSGGMFGASGEEAKKLSEDMMDAWLAFAKTGDPNHDGLEEWPAYETKNRSTMRLGRKSHVESDPLSAERKYWAENNLMRGE